MNSPIQSAVPADHAAEMSMGGAPARFRQAESGRCRTRAAHAEGNRHPLRRSGRAPGPGQRGRYPAGAGAPVLLSLPAERAGRPVAQAARRLRAVLAAGRVAARDPQPADAALVRARPALAGHRRRRPDDGAALFAANLAIVFSQLGEQTLLVDANLRAPRQQDAFAIKPRARACPTCWPAAPTSTSSPRAGLRRPVGDAGRDPAAESAGAAGARRLPQPEHPARRAATTWCCTTCRLSRPGSTRIAVASRAGGALLVTRKNYTRMLAHRPHRRAAGRRRLRDPRFGGHGVLTWTPARRSSLPPPLAIDASAARRPGAGMVAGAARTGGAVRADLLRPVHRPWVGEEQGHGPIIFGLALWLIYRKWPAMLAPPRRRAAAGPAGPSSCSRCCAHAGPLAKDPDAGSRCPSSW
jgi:hypothetical protein